MEKKNICCFTGPRPHNLPFGRDENSAECIRLKNELFATARSLAEQGVFHFISGMALGVDIFAAEAVLFLKEEFPRLLLEAAIPCADQAVHWTSSDRDRYLKTVELCDKKTVLQERFSPGCMQRRNRYMVDSSDILVAVCVGTSSGTADTVRYAEKTGKTVIKITLC